MSWKKLLLIAILAAGLSFAAAPRSEAGTHVSVGIGLGLPFAYTGYGYGYPGYYPLGYPTPYPYGYGYGYPYSGVSIGYYYGRPFFWRGGHRVFVARGYRIRR